MILRSLFTFALVGCRQRRRRYLAAALADEFGGAPLHIFGGYVLYMRGYAPVMAGRIDHLSVAISPEHILHGHFGFCAGLDGALEGGIGVGDVEEQLVAGQRFGIRRDGSAGEFVAEHECGVADF